MRKQFWIAAALLLSLLLTACGAAAPAAEPAAESPAETAEPTSAPEETAAPAAEPEKELLPPEFFTDAAFVGDSITGTLQTYTYTHDELGEPLFLLQASYSVRTIVKYDTNIMYAGRSMSLPDALAEAGVSRVFILLGTNDVGVIGAEETAEHYGVLVDRIREADPEMDVYIQSLTPMHVKSQGYLLNNPEIAKLNELLRALAEEKGCGYVDVASQLTDEDGNLIEEYSSDRYVHLTSKAGALWAEALRDPDNYINLRR